jgi:glycosyltransferase involved in cell wall biosynthesis
MKVSFIIPSFEQGKYLTKCLDSIHDQDLQYNDFEVLVFDGGSTDNTQQTLRKHQLKPKWVSRPDGGQANAVNQGMREAKGEIIAWINSDDYYLPNAIQTISDYFTKNADLRFIYGNAIRVDQNGRKMMAYPVEDWNYQRLLEKCYLCQPATFFRRKILQDHGFLNESFHLALDLEFWLRIGKHEPFLRVPEFLAAAREYKTNKSQSFPLRMQVEALWAGYMHTGKLCRKRLWSIAENLVFIHDKKLKRAMHEEPDCYLHNTLFWIQKIYRYSLLNFQVMKEDFPWQRLNFGRP